MSHALSGKVCLVTGGSRGIGLAIARKLLELGARVVVTGRRTENAKQALAELAPWGAVHGLAGDVRDPNFCAHLVEEAVRWGGGLDVLVNNAGVGIFKPVAETTLEEFRLQLETNLFGVFYLCRAALPHLLQAQGFIVNVASLAARNPFAGGAAYCASKAALVMFSECLMQEVRQQGVRVASVLPGSVDTEFGGGSPGASWKLAPEDVAQAVVDLLLFPPRALPSLVELRPSRPQKT
ncbi:MAG: SDR family oxidoreductase [Thermoanaerobaculum sp.]